MVKPSLYTVICFPTLKSQSTKISYDIFLAPDFKLGNILYILSGFYVIRMTKIHSHKMPIPEMNYGQIILKCSFGKPDITNWTVVVKFMFKMIFLIFVHFKRNINMIACFK